uniref:SET and MYND domain-containing protein 5 isoform X1 n=2 Tax=Ciona intestinalis TaxID=7719 RepID=UPI000180CE18|nr:SET and MYND domain-containing protein 5 isoform X1 [Ciona intestinalis]|eukprot:XP_002127168.1 SET and MYND domain-containing protein 5 isoform X1 [Ciona intestinalis]
MTWCIRHIDNVKGFGLFSTEDISSDSVILEEDPIISCQFSWNKLYKYRACDYCMKSLETTEEMCKRLAQNPGLKLPYHECCESNPVTYVHCQNEIYCSMECREKAYNEFHKILCPSSDLIDRNALEILDETWRGCHYPPETASIQMIIRILARIKQEEKKEEFISDIEKFCHASTNDVEQIAHKLLGEQFLVQLTTLREQLASVFFDESVQHWFTDDGFKNLFALLGTNQQGVGTSALSVWVHNCDELDLNPQDKEELDNLIDGLYEELENVAGSFLNCEGAGLYRIQSKCNHSCEPNAEVCFPNNNHRLAVKACRDIAAGEEITISYLSQCQIARGCRSRQQYLKENYLFHCCCSKCSEQTDEESSSDMED